MPFRALLPASQSTSLPAPLPASICTAVSTGKRLARRAVRLAHGRSPLAVALAVATALLPPGAARGQNPVVFNGAIDILGSGFNAPNGVAVDGNGEIFYSMKEIRVLAEHGAYTTTPSGHTLRWAINHQPQRLGGKVLGAWRSGNRYALPTSPHPRLRRSINQNSRATLTMKLVQKSGQTTFSNG